MSSRTPVPNWHWLLSGAAGSNELLIWLEVLGDTIPENYTKRTDLFSVNCKGRK